MKNKILLSVLLAILSLPIFAQNNKPDSIIKPLDERCIVSLETSLGNIKIALYNETPKHRDNFLKLVKNLKFAANPFARTNLIVTRA